MPFEIVRNDIVNMQVDVIVNTANPRPVIGSGVDRAIHQKAGKKLSPLFYRYSAGQGCRIGFSTRGLAMTGSFVIVRAVFLYAVIAFFMH